jgi:GT2 family glycosyltransferase
VLVVDNGSSDDSVSRISRAFPKVELIANDENYGFARGANIGLKRILESEAEFVVILNNDLVLDDSAVAAMVKCAQTGFDLVTAALFDIAEPERLISIGGVFNTLTLEKSHDAGSVTNFESLPEVLERDFVPGGATLISRRALERVGLFDERFFLYYEDADYSLLAKEAGLRAAVATRARMWHEIAASSGGYDSPRQRYWMARSSVTYFRKHARLWQAPIIIFWRTASALRTSWQLMRGGRRASLRAYWHGLWDGLSNGHSGSLV